MAALTETFGENPLVAILAISIWVIGLAVATTLYPPAGFAVAVVPLAIMWIARDQKNLLYLFLLVLPFENALLFGINLFGIQGAKPLNIVAILVITNVFLYANVFSMNDRVDRKAMRIFGFYILVFVITAARSVAHYKLFNFLAMTSFEKMTTMSAANAIMFPDTVTSYVLSYIVRPLVFALPFYVILVQVRTRVSVMNVLSIIGISMFVLSCCIIAAVASDPSALKDPTRFALADLFEGYFGLHYNDLATICATVCAPMLYLALRGNLFWKLNFGLLLVAVVLLSSRQGLITVALVTAAYLALERRYMLLMGAGVVGLIAIAAVALPTLDSLFSVGFSSGREVTADAISNGRIEHIWIPLIMEWVTNPSLLVFGAGRNGILTSPSLLNGVVLSVGHAHNGFIDFFLDTGLPLLIVLVVMIVRYVRKGWKFGRQCNDPLYWALYFSFIAYLLQCMTTAAFYPGLENTELFPVLGLLVVVVRLNANKIRVPTERRDRFGRPMLSAPAPAVAGQAL